MGGWNGGSVTAKGQQGNLGGEELLCIQMEAVVM